MALEARGEKIIKLNIGNPSLWFPGAGKLLATVSENLHVVEGYSDSKAY